MSSALLSNVTQLKKPKNKHAYFPPNKKKNLEKESELKINQ